MDLKLPTWEASKELADKLPGDKTDDAKCPKCGYDKAEGKESQVARRDKKG